MNTFFFSHAGWHSIGIVSLLGIFIFFFIVKKVFSFMIETVTSSVYPNYNPLVDRILINAKALNKTMSAEEFSKKYSCDYSLVIEMLATKKIQGYKEDDIWYVGRLITLKED